MFGPLFPVVKFPDVSLPSWHPEGRIFFGTTGDDWFVGSTLDDTMYGSPGRDTFVGGLGRDTVNYSGSPEGVDVSLSNYSASSGGHAEGDVLIGVEIVIGSEHDDYIAGDRLSNTILTRGGDDTIRVSGGADIIDGGAGIDTLFVRGTGMTIDLDRGIGIGGFADGDGYYNIENVDIGGSVATVIGNDADNWISGISSNFTAFGGGGSDTFAISNWGGERLDGGAGFDTVDYSTHTNGQPGFAGYVIDLDNDEAYAANGLRPTATLTRIEAAIGSDFDDTFIDAEENNTFTGMDGADVFVFDHDSPGQRDIITDFQTGLDIIDLSQTGVQGFGDLTDGGSRRLEQVGADAVVHTDNGSEIVLQGVLASWLDQSDFLF